MDDHEILTAEHPCMLCGQPLEVVTWFRADDGQERIERTRLDHNDQTCLATLALYKEAFPHVTR